MRTLPGSSQKFAPGGRPYASGPVDAWGSFRADGCPRLRTWERLDVASWTKYDPNTREGAAPVEQGEGVGVRFSLTGGWSTSDPATALWYIDPEPIRDVAGRKLAAPDQFSYGLQIVERINPALTSDIFAGLFLFMGTDVTSDDGIGGGFQWSSSTRASRRASVIAGTGSLGVVGSSNGSARQLLFPVHSNGISALRLSVGFGYVLSSAGAILNNTHGFSFAAFGAVGTGYTALHRALVLLRLAATDASTRTLDLDLYAHPGTASRLTV
jgi:hypothetical protein